MIKSDVKRLQIIAENSLNETAYNGFNKDGFYIINHEDGSKTYYERMSENAINAIIEKNGAETISEGLDFFIENRFKPVAYMAGYDVVSYDFTGKIFEAQLEPTQNNAEISQQQPAQSHSRFKEPGPGELNLPNAAFQKRSQNVRRVDLLVKAIFNSTIPSDFVITTDAGEWRPAKDLKNSEGKVVIIWENKDAPKLRIETTLFPEDSNEVIAEVIDLSSDEVLLSYKIEVYVIPTTPTQAVVFLRKVLFNQLKRWIDREVIRLKPFNSDFAFWRASNPDFAYSFKSPNKNTIVLDLINFVNIAQKPILDDFVEQNNLKHKQNYLRALLDSAEEAGIFQFEREGNEIKILKGKNFNEFLEGKVRRVV